MSSAVRELLLRVAASGFAPARFFLPSLPDRDALAARTGPLKLEIVSHCWNYSHLLAYQLSSLVNHPPSSGSARMTVFYSPEDRRTAALLEFFATFQVPGVSWNWQPLEKSRLFRRAIGRNRAARATDADWIWFTDCDVIFHRGCLDALIDQLQGRRDLLVYPRQEHCTPLLPETHPMLTAAAADEPRLVEIDPSQFTPRTRSRATGPMQITHGDVARAVGYCESLPVYHEPTDRWRKSYEDRAFRWLLRTPGAALDVPGVYRIRHASKGRYRVGHPTARIRGTIRRIGSRLHELGLRNAADGIKRTDWNPSPNRTVRRIQATLLRIPLLLRRTQGERFPLRVRLLDQWITLDVEAARELRRAGDFTLESALAGRIAEHLEPDNTVFDVGANIGLISLTLALHPAGRTCRFYCFEPEPRNFLQLKRNAEINGLNDRMFPYQLALGKSDGEAELFIRGTTGEGRHSMVSKRGSRSSIRVPLWTATRFAMVNNCPPHVVKIDVEGAEGDVLAGMSGLLDVSPPRDIFLEIHRKGMGNTMPDGQPIMEWLQRRGYLLAWEQPRRSAIHCHYARV